MQILKGVTYIFIFNINGRYLTYTGTVTDTSDSNFITFVDKYGVNFSYNCSTLISCEEIKK